jgi:hypothetical protein
MKHILVIGVRAKAANDLTRKFGSKVKFTWVTQQDNQSKLQKGAYDVVILCVKFCSHTAHQLYRSHPRLIRINGGQTDLINMIDKWR